MQGQKPSVRFIESCYRLYEQKMYRTACLILRDSQLAEDAVQEAFVKLMKGSVAFEDIQSDDCRRYLLTILKHASIDIYRKQQKLQETAYLTDQELSEMAAPENRDDFSGIPELLDSLPQKYRDVVYCLAVREFSVRETAERLGISEANVRKRLERARKMLNKLRKSAQDDTNFKAAATLKTADSRIAAAQEIAGSRTAADRSEKISGRFLQKIM